MKKLEKIFVASVIATLLCDGVAFGASRRGGSSARGGKGANARRASSTKRISGTYNRNTNTYRTSGTNIASTTTTSTETEDNSIVCGTPASSSNKYAKRKCALAYIEALKLYCKSYPCTSKAKVETSFNFGLPVIENKVSMDIDGKTCTGSALDSTCVAYQGDVLSEVWNLYSEKAVRERKHCNMARAKADVAQACLQYIQSEKAQSVDGILDASKKSKLDDGIDKTCGHDAIIKKYKDLLGIDDWDDTDEQYLSGMTIQNGEWTTASEYQGKKTNVIFRCIPIRKCW